MLVALSILAWIASAGVWRRHLHMFQLGGYRSAAQVHWLGQHRSAWAGQIMALFLAVLAGLWPQPWTMLLLIWLAIMAAALTWRWRYRAKKPLVATARVWRLVACAVLVGLILQIVGCWIASLGAGGGGAIVYILSPLLLLIANWINQPIEAAVRRHYLNQAKVLLAGQPGLTKIGITGSYGKTSFKYYLTCLLEQHFNVLMTPASFNTPMGITKTIRGQLRSTDQIFVCEMGAERVGDIAADCDLVHPTIGVITAIGEQHLATFGSQAAIIATKLELAQAVRGHGPLYLNGDNALLRQHQPDQTVVLYGLATDNDARAFDLRVDRRGSRFNFSYGSHQLIDLETALVGRHTVENLAGAIAVALDLGVSDGEIRQRLRRLEAAPHRLSLRQQGNVTILDDAYNSNPAGAKAALDTLMLFDGRRILITPGMVALGSRQDELNRQFGAQAAVVDQVFLVGQAQTAPIKQGLLEAGFPADRLTVVENVNGAIEQAMSSGGDQPIAILLENDLPDNY
ncbi:MAG: UDP-N-acetylmuramoyl-tripeptide--D-alanyl-D-alanine ligase [Propionibacteriaceae bacterium]|jgi:UDP-N-acetylmuramoyl-tripeptide--D-alanyl-D-alanine ligase|nr:UDP-N-acetylmuramoyl-tripeptide--D-alanyl-D-alanine ligase [Propionibacteriaceae bacterium]